jgi:hypothetical protein
LVEAIAWASADDGLRDLRLGSVSTIGLALVGASSEERVEWDPAEERRLDLTGESLATAGAEELFPGAGEVRHVLHNAEQTHVRLPRHLRRAHGDLLRSPVRSRDDHGLRPGRSCPSEMATSPVPGGMSTTSVSRSPQCTSERNCSSARWSIGPRHMIGVFSSRKKPMDMTLRSPFTGGTIILSTATGRWLIPSIVGIE